MLQTGASLGSYQILEKIGAGGMGSVYKAYHPALGRYVAIKVLPPQTAGDPAFGARFAAEARAIGKLRHPNIVTAYDFAQQGDLAYLVADYVDGGTLFDQLGGPLPLEYVLAILTPIASALDYAHARGVVHRDIKPQNILLSHDAVPVLTDFGLAKIIGPGSGITQAGALMGTAEYIAPECASGAEVAGPASDQYALAIIAYQMIAGRHPFPADNPLSALMAHVHKPVPTPTSIGVPLPAHVESALLKALAKKPEERFARASDFVRALGTPAPAASTAALIAPTTPTPAASAVVAPAAPPAVTAAPPSEPPARPATLPPAEPALSMKLAAPVSAADTTPSRPWWRRRAVLVAVAAFVVIVTLGLLNRPEPPAPAEVDDEGNSMQAAKLITPGPHPGSIENAGDVDFFRLDVPARTNLTVDLRLGTLPSASVALLGANGQLVAEERESGAKAPPLTRFVRDPGSYFIRVRGGADASGTYTLIVTAR